MPRAVYDEIADWYAEYVTGGVSGFTARAEQTLRQALGPGSGVCLDLACGTGVFTATVRELGWSPIGVDISAGQLRHASGELPVVQADTTALPVRATSVDAVTAVLCHTDVDDYAGLVRSAARVLVQGGRFVHVGVHPCFTGAFADRSVPDRVVISPGYWQRERRFDIWSPEGVRARVGATHLPLSDLIATVIGAGLVLDEVIEAGEIPDLLALRAHRP